MQAETAKDYALFGKHLQVAERLQSHPSPTPTVSDANKFIQAVEGEDQRAIADLIATGEDASIVDTKGRTLMHIAVENNSLAAVLALLEANIDLFHLDNDGKLAFDIAAERATTEINYALIASYLLEAMAGVKVKDPKGWPTLNWAVVSGNMQRIDCLLERGAKVGNGCQNALEIAILMQRDKVFKRLLAVEGIDAASRRGDTGLMSASGRGDLLVVDTFLEHGANVNVADLWHGFTILRIASEEGHTEIVKRLIAKGADAKAVDNLGETALHRAAAWGHLDVVRELIPISDVNAENIGGITPIMWAMKGRHIDVIAELIDAGAVLPSGQYGHKIDPQAADVNKLFAALTAEEQDIEAVKTALDHHARPDAINADKVWALHLAVMVGFTEAVEYLLAFGAAPSLQTHDGNTALHHAVLLQRKDEAKTLLRYNANPNVYNKAGMSPLSLAAKSNLLELAEIVLFEVGGVSKKTLKDALKVAKAAGNDEIAKSITKALEDL